MPMMTDEELREQNETLEKIEVIHREAAERVRDECVERVKQRLATCELIRQEMSLPFASLTLIERMLRREVEKAPVVLTEADRREIARLHDDSLAQMGIPTIPKAMQVALTMRSPTKITREQGFATVAAAGVYVYRAFGAMRVEQIDIKRPGSWIVGDIFVGQTSQFKRAGIAEAIGGLAFDPTGSLPLRIVDVVSSGLNFTMKVAYVGDNEDGEQFEAMVTGPAIV